MLDFQEHLAGLIGLGRELVGKLTTNHQTNDIRHLQLVGRLGGHPLAVTHDGDVVGDPLDFCHLVGDVDNAHALVTEHVDDPEQVLHFFLGQRGGGLVEHQHLGVVGDGLGDLHHLPLGDRHGAHDPVGIHVDFQLLENLHGIFVHFFLVDHDPAVGGIPAQPDVVHDGALQSLVQLLVHHGHAIVQGLTAALEVHFLAVQEDLTAILFVNTEQALHQGGLTGAVFPHQGMDGTGLDLQADIVQGFDTGEGLCDILHSQKNRFLHICVPPLGQKLTNVRFFGAFRRHPPAHDPLCCAVNGCAGKGFSLFDKGFL